MVFAYRVVIPKNTSRDSPHFQELPLHKGVIKKLVVLIPYGHMGLTHFALLRGNAQVFPVNPDQKFSGDGLVLSFDEVNYPLLEEPYMLLFEGWNEDDTYDHAVYLYLQVMTKKEFMISKGVWWPEEGWA